VTVSGATVWARQSVGDSGHREAPPGRARARTVVTPPRLLPSPASSPGAAVRVFVAGTFDGLHLGHVFLLNFARQRGSRLAKRLGRRGVHLTVVVARDDSVRRIKGRPPLHNERERRGLIQAMHAVDSVFIGYRGDFLRSVRRARPDLIVLGYDQAAGWEETLRAAAVPARVVRCPPYDATRLKSSRLRHDFARNET
jgi:FAD synthetase